MTAVRTIPQREKVMIHAILEIENTERQVAEASLQQLNAELEARVFERTRALQEMNAAMEADRQQLKLLTTGLSNISNSIIIADREGIIQWVNPAFGNIYGYSKMEALGKNAVELVTIGYKISFITQIRTVIEAKREWVGELRTCHNDGDVISEVTITPILDEQGEIVNFLIVSHDVTERIKAQQATMAAIKAGARAERLSSIGTIAAGISHEINQPLNSIKIISSGSLLMVEQGKEISSEEFVENLKEISYQTDTISNIISHLRAVIRKDESMVAPCDINVSVNNALGLIGKQLADHGIALCLSLQENLPSVLAISTGLEEVVVNLLVNGMQALDTLDIADKRITIRTSCDDGVAMLEIRDNGPGIRPGLVKRIFEPFYSTKAGGSNLGLGLAIVNSIVASYNGTIKAVSDGTSGTIFQVTFPALK